MKQKISRWNHLSIFFFGLSSGSLFGIPFLNLEHGFSGVAGDWVAAFGGKCFKKACRNKKTNGKRKMDGNSRIILSFPVDYDSMFLEK